MAKITTPVERIDQLLASYAELNSASHDLMDLHVAEVAATIPGVPISVIKQSEFTNRAGHMLNIPAALHLLRDKF